MAENNGTAPVVGNNRVKLSDIRENPAALRAVDRENEEYLNLVDSIRSRGVMNPIVVRQLVDPNTGATIYGLVDGLHRYSASQDAGLQDIPVNVINAEDYEVLEAQIITNACTVETKPVQYTKAIKRLMAANPLLTIPELARRLSKSPKWLNDRLSLGKLDPNIGALIDEGKINLTNGYALSKLPEDEQASYLDRAIGMSPAEFGPMVETRRKEISDARRQGRATTPATFQPVAYIQKMGTIKDELEKPQVGPYLLKECQVTDPLKAWEMAIAWILHLDPKSIEAQKLKDDQRKQESAAKKEALKKEREAKRQRDAAEESAKAQAEIDRLKAGGVPQLAGAAT